jgi:multidrug resistance efflux pump
MPARSPRPSIVFAVLLGLSSLGLAGRLGAEEEPKSASDQEPQSVKINGVVESLVSHEILADTEQIESLEITGIVPHGATVRAGQNIIWFDSEDVDKRIQRAEVDLRLSRLKLEDDEFAHQQFLETQKLDRETSELNRKQAQQDHDNFVRIDRDRQHKSAEYNLKSSRESLEYAMEELEQLEQMYKEDDLTEESEEIVLKRARNAVESAQFRLEGAEIQSDRAVQQEIPRTQAQQDDALARAQLAYQQSIRNLNSERQRRELELNRKRDEFQEAEEKLADLRTERKRLVLTAPIDGVLLHGKLNRGQLGDKPSTLEAGSKVTATQVLATVVDPGKLHIRVDLDEKHLATVTAGSKCTVRFAAFPGHQTEGTVKAVSDLPYAATKFDVVVNFRRGKQEPAIGPTMSCELEFKSEAVPPSDEAKASDDEAKKSDDEAAKADAPAEQNVEQAEKD